MRRQYPPLNTLAAFAEVARLGSISKASERLCVTHSAISQAVKALEGFLEQKLFNRQPGKPITLTQAGENYFRDIDYALRIITDATREQKINPILQNQITINMMPSFALFWFIPKLSKFRALFPDIDVRISSIDISGDFEFYEKTVDICIPYGSKPKWHDCHIELLLEDKLCLIGAGISDKTTLKTALQTQKAIYIQHDLRKNDWETWCDANNIEEPPLDQRIFFSGTIEGLQAVGAGLGILVTHTSLIQDSLHAGNFQLLSDVMTPTGDSFYLTYPSESHDDNVTALINWIKQEADEFNAAAAE